MKKETNAWITPDIPGSIPLPKAGLEGTTLTAIGGDAQHVPDAWVTPDIPGSIPLPKAGLEGTTLTATGGDAQHVPDAWITPDIPGSIPLPKAGLEGTTLTATGGDAQHVPDAWVTPDIPGSIPLPKVGVENVDLTNHSIIYKSGDDRFIVGDVVDSTDGPDQVEPDYPIIDPEENRIIIDDGIIPIDDPVDPPPVIEAFQLIDQKNDISEFLEELFLEKVENYGGQIDYAGLVSSSLEISSEYSNCCDNIINDMNVIGIFNFNDLY